tara:strand:- start:1564 stop:2748 length:1185 start_codon:yes stop_codon:yes gene_type:complete
MLASKLSIKGINIILVDKLRTCFENSFSSAAVPINSIKEYPELRDSVSSYWRTWQIIGPKCNSYQWHSTNSLGAILDFSLLRESLWKKSRKLGVEILLGWRVLKVISHKNYAEVHLIDQSKTLHVKKVDFVVDATGQARDLLLEDKIQDYDSNLHSGTGLEWVLRCDTPIYKLWANKLSFLIGPDWVPYGYGWIFPISDNRLKVGVCSLPPDRNKSPKTNSYFLKKIIEKYFPEGFEVLDKHGGTIRSTYNMCECHVRGRIFGVGDSIGTANLLGGEGIRHGIHSACILSDFLYEINKERIQRPYNEITLANRYKKRLRPYFNWRWTISNKIGIKTWKQLYGDIAELKISSLLNILEAKFTAKDMNSILFDYKFEKFGFKLFKYFLKPVFKEPL